jgi:hypothetical protein
MDILPYLLLPLAGPEEFDLEVGPYTKCRSRPSLTLSLIGSRAFTTRSPIPSANEDTRARLRPPTHAC